MRGRRITRAMFGLGLCLILPSASLPQHEHGDSSAPDVRQTENLEAAQGEAHVHHPTAASLNRATAYLLNLSSGTSLNPGSWSMPMVMSRAGAWNLMWMGQAFIVNTQQTGPRGGDKFYSTNWSMLGAGRNLGRGGLMLRAMASLEPLTVRNKRYPLLFQTGETANGRPIVDGQHPHELIMELGVHYAHPLGERALANVYYAAVGEVALGPVAYPHRASAMDLPQSALGHHWQDSTHIANNVLTVGLGYGKLRIEAGGFHGKEPDENRWNIDAGAMDSWSGRLSYQPSRNWYGQVSAGRIRNPESTHTDDVVRATASVHYTRPLSRGQDWSSSLVWARNHKTDADYSTHAVLAETVLPVSGRNFLTGRFEWSQRDELFEYDHDLAHEIFEQTGERAFNVAAYTIGYARVLGTWRSLQTGLGFNFTAYTMAATLKPFYGERPVGTSVFLRFRLRPAEQ